MQGSIRRRYKGSWSLILDVGYQVDPETGKLKRKQKWVTFRGTRREAETKLAELITSADSGQFIERSKITVEDWLKEWVEKAVKPPAKRLSTYETYVHVINTKLAPSLGAIRLQDLKAVDMKRYYDAQRDALSQSTLAQHHAILHSALTAAAREGLVARNTASLVIGKPRAQRDPNALAQNCWDADEAKKFMKAAKEDGPQFAAFGAFALDTGARRGEMCGLRWSDVDLDDRTVTFMQQLVKPGTAPVFGPLKTGGTRTVDLSTETVALLRVHKRHQSELRMANRTVYKDLGLVFAKEWGHLHGRKDSLGLPLQANNLGQQQFARIIKSAGVRPITIHGLRHTSATLLLKAGVAPHVVQHRLGHKRVEMTLNIYAHALPSMQRDAADRLAELLHG